MSGSSAAKEKPSGVARRLKQLRDEFFGGKNSKMSDETGVDASTLSRIFKGETDNPSNETVLKVLKSVENQDGRSLNRKWLEKGKGQKFEKENRRDLPLSPRSDTSDGLGSLFSQETKMIVHTEATVAAGDGRIVYRDDTAHNITVPTGFLNRLLGFRPPSEIFVMEADGDSMEPTIENGDLVVAEPVEELRSAGIYVVDLGRGCTVKRIQPHSDGSLTVIPDNTTKQYEKETLEPTKSGFQRKSTKKGASFQVIGRVRFPDRNTDELHIEQVGSIIRSLVKGNDGATLAQLAN